MEKVTIPEAGQIEIEPRKMTTLKPGEYYPYSDMDGLVPRMTRNGLGHNIHVTGLTHDKRGYPAMNVKGQNELVSRLMDKIRLHTDDIIKTEESGLEDADVVVISFGISSRVAVAAIDRARAEGKKVGSLRLITVWPFAEKKIRELAEKVKAFVVVEMNQGQITREVERCVSGKAPVLGVLNYGGAVHNPDTIYETIKGATR